MLSGPRRNSRPANWSTADEFDDGSPLAVGEGANGLAVRDGNAVEKTTGLGPAPSTLRCQQVEHGHCLDASRHFSKHFCD